MTNEEMKAKAAEIFGKLKPHAEKLRAVQLNPVEKRLSAAFLDVTCQRMCYQASPEAQALTEEVGKLIEADYTAMYAAEGKPVPTPDQLDQELLNFLEEQELANATPASPYNC